MSSKKDIHLFLRFNLDAYIIWRKDIVLFFLKDLLSWKKKVSSAFQWLSFSMFQIMR